MSVPAKRIRRDFPRAVRVLDQVPIEMRDGATLWARIWLPEDAEADPVPAILEYVPYRKDDSVAVRDAGMHPYFAGFGYAAIRVDMRGSGSSDGLLLDEYLPQELQDACDVLAWLERQPWCTGSAGMFGKSWGGYNGLQVAALAPPQLRAVISAYSTDDRYRDDIHYLGGAQYAYAHLSWASTMLAFNGRPPDPAVVGERWREMWMERLERTPPYIEEWVRHQRRSDDFYKHGSVRVDYDAIRCPVYMVGGWIDPLRNVPLRFMEHFRGTAKALIGPWAHVFPHDGLPGPAIGFLQECLRWWDQHLKGIDTGIMDEPPIRTWMQEAVPPQTGYAERPGRWIAEPSWPSPHVSEQRIPLGERTLGADGPEVELRHAGDLAHGSESGNWFTFGSDSDFAPDQRGEDGRSLCFDSAPLRERTEMLGYAGVDVTVVPTTEVAQLAVRLCDVAPDGRSTLVSFGVLNLTHRDGHDEPRALVPGEPARVTVRMFAQSYAFPAGHRLRLALAPSYWPWVWPAPDAMDLLVRVGGETGAALLLPVRTPHEGDERLEPFEPAEGPPPLVLAGTVSPGGSRTLARDLATGELHSATELALGGGRLDDGLEFSERGRDDYHVVGDDPLTARARSRWTARMGRGAWRTRIETDSTMSADRDAYLLTNTLHAYENEREVFASTRTVRIPRDLA
jgi:uncharacterized protein